MTQPRKGTVVKSPKTLKTSLKTFERTRSHTQTSRSLSANGDGANMTVLAKNPAIKLITLGNRVFVERFSYSKIVHGDFPTLGFDYKCMFYGIHPAEAYRGVRGGQTTAGSWASVSEPVQ